MEKENSMTAAKATLSELVARMFNDDAEGRKPDAASLSADFQKIREAMSFLGLAGHADVLEATEVTMVTVFDGKKNRRFALPVDTDRDGVRTEIDRMTTDVIKKQVADFLPNATTKRGAEINVKARVDEWSLKECLGKVFAGMPVGREMARAVLDYINTGDNKAFLELENEISRDLPEWMADTVAKGVLSWRSVLSVDIGFPDGSRESKIFLADDLDGVREWLETDLLGKIDNPSIKKHIASEVRDFDPGPLGETSFGIKGVNVSTKKGSIRKICALEKKSADAILKELSICQAPTHFESASPMYAPAM